MPKCIVIDKSGEKVEPYMGKYVDFSQWIWVSDGGEKYNIQPMNFSVPVSWFIGATVLTLKSKVLCYYPDAKMIAVISDDKITTSPFNGAGELDDYSALVPLYADGDECFVIFSGEHGECFTWLE
jgi:hypothetical protein